MPDRLAIDLQEALDTVTGGGLDGTDVRCSLGEPARTCASCCSRCGMRAGRP